MKQTASVVFLFLLLGSQPVEAKTSPPHPRVHQVSFAYPYNWEWHDYEAVVTLALGLTDGKRQTAVTATLTSFYNHTQWKTAVSPAKLTTQQQTQLTTFLQYSTAILGCQDSTPAAHVYDDPTSHDPSSPITIYNYAQTLWWYRQTWQCDGNSQTPPPPLPQPADNTCHPTPPDTIRAGSSCWVWSQQGRGNGRLAEATIPTCDERIAQIALFWRLTLLQGTVWNIAFANLESPYDYSAGQLGLHLLAMGYPTTKLDQFTDYLTLWNRTRNLDNVKLQRVAVDLQPLLRLVAADLAGTCSNKKAPVRELF